MAELKTQKNDASVEAFLDSVEDEKKRQDSYAILELMKLRMIRAYQGESFGVIRIFLAVES